jgi:hypothetical protein
MDRSILTKIGGPGACNGNQNAASEARNRKLPIAASVGVQCAPDVVQNPISAALATNHKWFGQD